MQALDSLDPGERRREELHLTVVFPDSSVKTKADSLTESRKASFRHCCYLKKDSSGPSLLQGHSHTLNRHGGHRVTSWLPIQGLIDTQKAWPCGEEASPWQGTRERFPGRSSADFHLSALAKVDVTGHT